MTPYTKQIVELHKIHKAIENCGCNKDDEQGGGDSGNLLMSLIPSDCPKPDLFLFRRNDEDNNPIDVTNYKIDDFINFWEQQESDFTIMCLYESSDLNPTIINYITFGIDDIMYFGISSIPFGTIITNEVSYNNKVYYYYYSEQVG